MPDSLADLPQINFILSAVLIAAGIGVHFLKKLYDLEQAGTILLPTTFIAQKPYTFALAVSGAYLLAALCYFTGQLNYAVSILIGVTCSSAFDTLRARAAGKLLDKEPPDVG